MAGGWDRARPRALATGTTKSRKNARFGPLTSQTTQTPLCDDADTDLKIKCAPKARIENSTRGALLVCVVCEVSGQLDIFAAPEAWFVLFVLFVVEKPRAWTRAVPAPSTGFADICDRPALRRGDAAAACAR